MLLNREFIPVYFILFLIFVGWVLVFIVLSIIMVQGVDINVVSRESSDKFISGFCDNGNDRVCK